MNGKCVLWTDVGQTTIADEEVRSPESGEVLIRTEVTLISPGTERAFLLGLPNTPRHFPRKYGYCNVGEIIELGSGVSGAAVGDRVLSGGNHAQFVVVSAGNVFRIPEEVPSREAVFANLTSISIQAVRKASIELGEPVLIIGQGLIGNLALQLSRLSGGFPVIAMDTEANRLDLAQQCGADHSLNRTEDDWEDQLLGWTNGKGPAVVIEATGSPEPINTALKVAARLGRVVLLASTRGENTVNFYRDVHAKGLSIIGAQAGVRPDHDSTAGFWTATDDCELILRLLSAGRLNLEPLISHEFDAMDAPRAYELLVEYDPGFMGALLDWTKI